MKILRIQVEGLPLFKEQLDICFYANQRIYEDDKNSLYQLTNTIYLNPTNAFIGINASGKTSVLNVIHLAISILNNEPINHVNSKLILQDTVKATFRIYFIASEDVINCLETTITSHKDRLNECVYSIVKENLYEKPIDKLRKNITNFEGIEPVAQRSETDSFLLDDVSFIIARNKERNEKMNLCSLMSYTNVNVLPFSSDIPLEVISFLDPTVEKLYFEKINQKNLIHLKFKGKEEILLNDSRLLELYLSSGTIKGIITFLMIEDVFENDGYLLIDEIENHFNKEIVRTILAFFMDKTVNKNGAILVFTTHYPELLDVYERNDSINIVRNENGITITNLSNILTRNDIKKSDAYESGYLQGTTPKYESYLKLKKKLSKKS